MARLPTVVLERKVPGGKQTRKVNQTDYARDINRFVAAGWKAVSWRRGDATDDVVERAAQQALVEIERTHIPGHIASKDEERAFESRTIHLYETEEPKEEAKEEPKEEDWRKLPWFSRRKYVKEQTGQTPKNAEDAERIMAEHDLVS